MLGESRSPGGFDFVPFPTEAGAVPDPDKRMLRDLKRTLKKRGNKHRRAELKKNLAANPEEAAHAEEDLGGYRSDALNKLDNDSTRKKKDEGKDEKKGE